MQGSRSSNTPIHPVIADKQSGSCTNSIGSWIKERFDFGIHLTYAFYARGH